MKKGKKADKDTLYKLKELLGIGPDCGECQWFVKHKCTKNPDVCVAIDDLLSGDVMLEELDYDSPYQF